MKCDCLLGTKRSKMKTVKNKSSAQEKKKKVHRKEKLWTWKMRKMNGWKMIIFIEDANFTQTSDLQESPLRLKSVITIIKFTSWKLKQGYIIKVWKNGISSKKWDAHQ